MGIALGSTAIADVKLSTTQVDKIYLGSTEVWSKPAPVAIKALKFTSPGAQTFNVNNAKLGSIALNFEYSLDNGTTWTQWNTGNPISFGNGIDLYIRGINSQLATTGDNYTNFVFSTSSPVYCSGNVMHLYDYTQDLTTIPGNNGTGRGLKYLFQSCTQLVTAPSLPATTLCDYCYYYMFDGCTSLTTPPALPATTLAQYCYFGMFQRCTSLNAIAALPAPFLQSQCYYYMYQDCSSIKLSTTKTDEYENTFSFGSSPSGYATDMFKGTGGTFTGTPTQLTYYTSNTIIS